MTREIGNRWFGPTRRTARRGLIGLLLALSALAMLLPTGCASTAQRVDRREDRRDDRRDRVDERLDTNRELRQDRRDDRAERLDPTR